MPVVNLSVATDEAYRDKDGKRQERTEWHRVVVIGKMALTCREYLKKGRQIFVEGRLRTREWETTGAPARRTEIVANRVQGLGAPPAEQVEAGETEDSGGSLESEAPL